MRKLFVGLGMAGLLFVGSSEAIAQKTSTSKELNERIKALRSRLQDFQTKNVRQTSARPDSGDETAGLIIAEPEMKGEKIVEELESRSDVAVTVLFHDPDSVSTSIPDSPVNVPAPAVNRIEKLVLAKAPPSAIKKFQVVASLKTQVSEPEKKPVTATEKASVAEKTSLDSRTQRYENLRQRVYLATRNARVQAGEINRQVASLP